MSDSGNAVGCFDRYLTSMNSRIGFWYRQSILVVVDIFFDLDAVFCCQLFAIDEPIFHNKFIIFKDRFEKARFRLECLYYHDTVGFGLASTMHSNRTASSLLIGARGSGTLTKTGPP